MTTDALDDRTTERLLRGALSPDDAPPGYGEVARLLRSARAEAGATDSSAEGVAEHSADATVAAMVAAIAAQLRPPGRTRRRSTRLAAVGSTAAVVLFGGLTAAGALPAAAQDHVSTVLAKVGIDVPAGHAHDGRGPKAHPPTDGTDGTEAPAAGEETNHGDCVSAVAGSGGPTVRVVAQSDCGKPPTAGGPSTEEPNAQKGGSGEAPPAHARSDETPSATHPSGNDAGGSGGRGGDNANSGSTPAQDKKPK